MDRVAVFVDAGYLFAQGSRLLTGAKTERSEVKIDYNKLLEALERFATDISGVPLLRIYWYDATFGGPSQAQLALGSRASVKVRLGSVSAGGRQKGVDSLIVRDMITLARNRSMCDAVLLSGDEDVRVGVQEAQELGIRVHLLGIIPGGGSQSQALRRESDTTSEWNVESITAFMSKNPRSAKPAGSGVPAEAPATAVPLRAARPKNLEELAKIAADKIDPAVLECLVSNFDATHQLPPDVDRPLMGLAGKSFGRLDVTKRRDLRNAFVRAMKTRLPPKQSATASGSNPRGDPK
jgi:uncharacterized LabA/DUF88 family protein